MIRILLLSIIWNSAFSQADSLAYINSKKVKKYGLTIGGFIRPAKTLDQDHSFPYSPYDKKGYLDESNMYKNALGNVRFLNYLVEAFYIPRGFDFHILGFNYLSKSFFPDPGGVGAGSGLVRIRNHEIYYEYQLAILKPRSSKSLKCFSPYVGCRVLYSNKYVNYYLLTEDASNRMNEVSFKNNAILFSAQPTLGYNGLGVYFIHRSDFVLMLLLFFMENTYMIASSVVFGFQQNISNKKKIIVILNT